MNASLQVKRAQGFTERVSGISPLRTRLLALSLCSFDTLSPQPRLKRSALITIKIPPGCLRKGESVPTLLRKG